MIVTVISIDARRHYAQDLGRDRRLNIELDSEKKAIDSCTNLVVRNVVVGAHTLYLSWCQHPPYIVDDFYVSRGCLNDVSANA